jgi:hypothetical protein
MSTCENDQAVEQGTQARSAMEEPMSYELRFTQESTFLHAVVTGTNSKENVATYLGEVRRECVARNCFRVLIEERLEGPRLGVMDVFDVASEGSARAPAQITAMAYVDVNGGGDLMRFAETVAVNRGLSVRVFSSVSDAREWLLREVE